MTKSTEQDSEADDPRTLIDVLRTDWSHKRTVLSFILIGLLLASQAARADVDVNSANYIMPGCRGFLANQPVGTLMEIGIFSQGVCAGITSALFGLDRQLGVCTPKGAKVKQVMRVIVTYIDARPARVNESFLQLA